MRGNGLGQRDANEAEIVDALRRIGASVFRLHEPADLLVGYRGRTFLIECKMPAGGTTPHQDRFRKAWRGQYDIAHSPAEAVVIVTAN